MNIRFFNMDDLPNCVDLFTRVMNRPPWNEQWIWEIAQTYLSELVNDNRFVGFVVFDAVELLGAAFCHEKTWWTGDQLVIDDFFVSSAYQGKGYGTQLLSEIENYAVGVGISGITLLTDKNISAHDFYLKNGFLDAGRMTFMFKNIAQPVKLESKIVDKV